MNRQINVLVLGRTSPQAAAILSLLGGNGFAPAITFSDSHDVPAIKGGAPGWDIVLRGDELAGEPADNGAGNALAGDTPLGDTPLGDTAIGTPAAEAAMSDQIGNIAEGFLLLDADGRLAGHDDFGGRVLAAMSGAARDRIHVVGENGAGRPRANGATGADGLDRLVGAVRHSQGSCELHCADGRTLLAIEKPLNNRQTAIQFIDVTALREARRLAHERDEQLRQLADNLPGFIYHAVFEDGLFLRYTYASSGLRELCGLEPEDLMRDVTVLRNLIHPDDRGKRDEGNWRAAYEGVVFDCELRLNTLNKGLVWARFISRPRKLPDGTTVWDGMAIDITEIKRLEHAMRDREEQLRAIADNIPGFIYQTVLAPDGASNVTYASSALRDLFGIDPEALKRDNRLFIDAVHPEDREARAEALRRAGRDETGYASEFRILTPHRGERWVRTLAKPRRLEQGTMCWEGVLLDVTDVKHGELALREREEMLRGIADNLPGFIYQALSKPDGTYDFVYVSPAAAELFGIPPEALTDGSVFAELVHPEDRATRARALRRATRDGSVLNLELRLNTPHRGTRWIRVVSKPRPMQGQLRLWDGLMLDITDAKLAEEAVRQRDERLRGIADNLPGFVFQNSIKEDGTYDFTYVSSGSRRLIGLEPEALLQDSSLYIDLIHPEDRPRRDAGLLRSIREGVPYEMEWRLLTPHRGVRWVKAVVTPGRLENGRRLCDGIVLDITEAKQAELELRERDEQLRGIADNLPGFIYQCIRGGDGLPQFTYASSGLRELCDIEPAALIEDSTLFSKIVYGEDQEERRALAERARAGVPFEHEVRLHTAAKGLRWIRSFARPRSLPGGLTVWDGLILDITALKDAQAALGVSEARFRQIFDENPIAMALVTTDTYRIVQVNLAYCLMLEYTAEELIERSRDDFVVPEDRGIPAAAPPGMLPQWHPADKRFITKTGDTVYARVCVMRLGALSSGEGVALGIAIDVTEQRRAETALQQAQKMEAIGNLTGGMAHDFNNILGIIVGNLGLARNRLGGDEEMTEIVGEALDAAWRGADLTRRLLAFARRQPLRPARIDVNELIPDTVRLLRRLLGESIDVSLRLGPKVWPVMADPAQLEASLANLATNARDAMPRGGTLIVATANRRLDADYASTHPDVVPGEYVMIEVSDTGTGMSPGTMRQIFEPFFTTKEVGKGTGLGLSMVFGFLRQSGGHVNVYSEPGVGTTFRLFLPRLAIEDTQERDIAETVPTAMGAGEVVLVVEDNPGMRRIAVRQLEELGYCVLECDRGSAALQVLRQEQVDLLFTDIVMPGGLDGVELAHQAREQYPMLAIVLTSGFPQDRLEGDGDDLGNLQLLSKPYSKEELAAAIRSALDG